MAPTINVGTGITHGITKEDVEKLYKGCAEACRVDRGIIEQICPATKEQVYRMEHHMKTGSYMMQMVLHYDGALDHSFLIRVLNGIRSKNDVLRMRLVKHEGQVHQVILKDSLRFLLVETSIDAFLAENSRVRMGFGTPLLRYAFVRKPHSESFFVRSVHCCAVDNWTLCMLFDDLQTACSDVAAYCELPPRPAYGAYTTTLELDGNPKGRTFWRTHHMTFDRIKYEFPVLGPEGAVSPCKMRLKKLLRLPKVEKSKFSQQTMGHAAWALTIARLQKRDKLRTEDVTVSFISMTSARKSNFGPIKEIMGPISARVPFRIHISPKLSLEDLMADIDNQFTSMIGFEYCAMQCLSSNDGRQKPPTQAVFSWNPPGSDLSSRSVVCSDKTVAPAVLTFREDLSWPYTHNHGLMFEVCECEDGEHVAMSASWDGKLISADRIRWLVDGFARSLTLIVKSKRSLTLKEAIWEK